MSGEACGANGVCDGSCQGSALTCPLNPWAETATLTVTVWLVGGLSWVFSAVDTVFETDRYLEILCGADTWRIAHAQVLAYKESPNALAE